MKTEDIIKLLAVLNDILLREQSSATESPIEIASRKLQLFFLQKIIKEEIHEQK